MSNSAPAPIHGHGRPEGWAGDGGGGTDTDKIFVSRQGVPSALVSLPLRCMHSVVETAHLDDIERIIRLLTDLVLGLKDKDDFCQRLG
jgi:endoglucanase